MEFQQLVVERKSTRGDKLDRMVAKLALALLLIAAGCSDAGDSSETEAPTTTPDSAAATTLDPAPTTTSSEADLPAAVDAEDDLLGYRASLSPSDEARAGVNLNGTRSVVGAGFSRDVTVDEIVVDTIDMPFPVIIYPREDDELFVMGGTPLKLADNVSAIDGLAPGENDTAPYIAKVNPKTDEIIYLDLDRGTGLPYLGGALLHADGYVYVVSQSHLYKIEPESMEIVVSVDLPGGGVGIYNGLAVGRSGQLILKNFGFGGGMGTLLLVDPQMLETVFSTDCACASPRLRLELDDNGIEHLYHLNQEETFRYIVEESSLTLDETWIARFDPDGIGINPPPTSPVIFNDRVFSTTNTNSQANTPMRVFWQDVNATYSPENPPLEGPLLFEDPQSRVGYSFSGLVADEGTGILFAQDQARGLVNAFRPTDDGEIEILWQRELTTSLGSISVSDRQMIYFTDYVEGSNHLVVLDILTGDELLRIPTPATRASNGNIALQPNGDVYMVANEPGEPTGFLVRFSAP